MKKILTVLLALPILSFASSLDMSKLECKGVKLNASTTLGEVQNTCMIKEQKNSKGLYEVKFVNNANKKTVTCYFAKNDPKALLNSCK